MTPRQEIEKAIEEHDRRVLRYFIDDHQGPEFTHNAALVESWSRSLVDAVLEEAAKASCMWCHKGVRIIPRANGAVDHEPLRDSSGQWHNFQCKSAAIHALKSQPTEAEKP